jgi:hypothetical protein
MAVEGALNAAVAHHGSLASASIAKLNFSHSPGGGRHRLVTTPLDLRCYVVLGGLGHAAFGYQLLAELTERRILTS